MHCLPCNASMAATEQGRIGVGTSTEDLQKRGRKMNQLMPPVMRTNMRGPLMPPVMRTNMRGPILNAIRDYRATRAGLPTPQRSPAQQVITVVIFAGLLYAGYKRGQKMRSNKRLIWPFLGWSLLGPVGPGYLIGRLTA